MRRTLVIALVLAAPAVAHAGAVHLRIRYDDRAGHVRRATLDCVASGPRATGFLHGRDAARLCRRAYELEQLLARPPRTDRPCTMVYGGPDRARIRGNVRGAAVDRSFSRTNGCEIADWDRAQLLLPRPE
jgi:hypothetical protein